METNRKNKFYLVGYMGAGKTTVGRLLAKKLNWTFTDVDCFIENRYHQTITSIFEEKGEACFRKIEHHALMEISSFEKVVVSTGGGMPCFFDNMDIMNRTGITIYLKASVTELIKRIYFNKEKRPLIKGKNQEELFNFIETSLKQRESFYNRAKFVLDVLHCWKKIEISQWVDELLDSGIIFDK